MPTRHDYDQITYELYDGSAWVEVSEDVIGVDEGTTGIKGWGPLDRVASTGVFSFSLKNINNQYTPSHTNCIIADFGPGTIFRLIFILGTKENTRFYGRIPVGGIALDSDVYHPSIRVTVHDYIDQLANHEIDLPEFVQNRRINEVVPLIVANLPIAPLATEYNPGQDIFATVFDTTKPKTRALQEISKVTQSELGFVYVRPGLLSDEILVVEGRYTRVGQPLSVVSISDYPLVTEHDAVFHCNMSTHPLSYGNHYYNHVRTVTYPRRVDEVANVVLFFLNRFIAIDPGATVSVIGRFIDPDQEAVSVAGIDMVDPLVATTDYLFNAASDGTGANMTADLAVSATFGTNGVEFELTNSSANLGYVTHLQARGRGVYTYRPVEFETRNDLEINAYGKRTLDLRMPYQDNPLVGEDFALNLLDLWSATRTSVEAIGMSANQSEFLLNAFIDLHVGDRIRVTISDINIDSEFYIHSIQWQILPGSTVHFIYGLQPANTLPSESYWLIGEAGFSEIGETTILGF